MLKQLLQHAKMTVWLCVVETGWDIFIIVVEVLFGLLLLKYDGLHELEPTLIAPKLSWSQQ